MGEAITKHQCKGDGAIPDINGLKNQWNYDAPNEEVTDWRSMLYVVLETAPASCHGHRDAIVQALFGEQEVKDVGHMIASYNAPSPVVGMHFVKYGGEQVQIEVKANETMMSFRRRVAVAFKLQKGQQFKVSNDIGHADRWTLYKDQPQGGAKRKVVAELGHDEKLLMLKKRMAGIVRDVNPLEIPALTSALVVCKQDITRMQSSDRWLADHIANDMHLGLLRQLRQVWGLNSYETQQS